MPAPTKLNQTPVGWIRGSFGGRTVFFIDSLLPLSRDVETMKLADELPVGDVDKQYWVFSVPKPFLDVTGDTFTVVQVNPGIKAFGFDSYDDAEAKYEDLAKLDAGKPSVKRGIKGLLRIGKRD